MSVAVLRRNGWVLGAAVLSLVLTVQPFRDSDVWWHLAIGHYILAHGIPAVEPFSFLHAANPWVGQQWLYEVTLARLVDLGGPGLASLLMGVVASAALLLAALSIPPERRPRGPGDGRRPAAQRARGRAAARRARPGGQPLRRRAGPLPADRAGGAARRACCSRCRRCSRCGPTSTPGSSSGSASPCSRWWWSRGVDRRRRRLLGVAIVGGALATLLNPAGPGLWSYVGATFTDPTITGVVTEWQSPNFHDVLLRALRGGGHPAGGRLGAGAAARPLRPGPRRRRVRGLAAGAAQRLPLRARRRAPARRVRRGGVAARTARACRGCAPAPRLAPPPRWFGAAVLAVVVARHGGGGGAAAQRRTARRGTRRPTSRRRPPTTSPRTSPGTGCTASTPGAATWPTASRPGGWSSCTTRPPSSATPRCSSTSTCTTSSPDWDAVLSGNGIADAIVPAGSQEVAALHHAGLVGRLPRHRLGQRGDERARAAPVQRQPGAGRRARLRLTRRRRRSCYTATGVFVTGPCRRAARSVGTLNFVIAAPLRSRAHPRPAREVSQQLARRMQAASAPAPAVAAEATGARRSRSRWTATAAPASSGSSSCPAGRCWSSPRSATTSPASRAWRARRRST